MRRFLLISILLVSVFFSAFNPSEFLYADETSASISYENFTRLGSQYSLVKISGQPTFLLSNGTLINDSNLIDSIITPYYREQYYLTDSEIEELRNLISLYNISRNDGDIFRDKEEYVCREGLFLNGITYGNEKVTCATEDGCKKLSMIIYNAPFAEGIRRNFAIETFVGFMMDFSSATFGNDELLSADYQLLLDLSPSNAHTSLQTIKSSIPTINANSVSIESSIFRTPRRNDDADRAKCINENCLGLCPDLNMNETYLSTLDSRLDVYLSRLTVVSDFTQASKTLVENSNARMEYVTEGKEAARLTQIFEPVRRRAVEVLSQAKIAQSHVKNTKFSQDIVLLESKLAKINQSIQNRLFETVLSDIEQVDSSTQDLLSQSDSLEVIYSSALTAKDDADAVLFLLEIREISDESQDRFAGIRSNISTLNARFAPGLTEGEYVSFRDNYLATSTEANALLEEERSRPMTATVSKIRGFSRRVNHGLENFLILANAQDLPKTTDPKIFFGSFAIINFVSFTSLAVLMFLMIYRAFAPNKIALSFLFALLSAAILIFSGILFIYTEKTANNADLGEFLDEVSHSNITTVFVDTRGAESPQVMLDCANRVVSGLEDNNISVHFFSISQNECVDVRTGTPSRVCNNLATNTTSIFMNYSQVYHKPTFKTVFQPHAYISGNTMNYKLCPLGLVLEG